MPIPQFIHKKTPEPSRQIYSPVRPQNPEPKRKKIASRLSFLRYITKKGVILAIFIGLLLILGGFFYLSQGLPDPNKLIERQVAQSTRIYDRTGKTVLYEIYGDQKRTLVGLNDIPQNVRNATIAIEDKNFYKHGGFSLWAIFRTVVTNVIKNQKAGGSTLTQQLVKNAILTNEKSYVRKVKELILAYQMEKRFSKDEILQMYLNEIPYGSTAYGVESASQRYFGKRVQDVSLAEAAILAALPQAPSRYSPYGPNRDLLISRQRYVLDVMSEQGHISKDEAEAAKKVEITFTKPKENILAPHFVMYLKNVLSEKYGDKTIEQGGLKIISSIDIDKQKAAEEAIAERVEKNDKYQASNAALVSIDPKTGQILAMVGSKDYFSDKIDGQVNIATSPRQPGSSFKPIVYATAFAKGYTPDTVLYDLVTNFSTDADKKYEPHNYDGAEHGPVTIRKALAGSLNIPAVKAMYLAGVNSVMEAAKKLGYSTLNDKDRFGLSLVLGGGEVQLLEHVNAYSAFSQDGLVHAISPVLRVEDKSGKILEEYQDQSTKAFEPQVARQITSILSDNNARSYVFGSRNFLTLSDRPVAAKTGTTNDYKDAWTVGYTPSLVTGVWVGNNDATSMKRGADGSVVAAPIWNAYMKKVLAGTPIENFTAPESVKTGKPVLDGAASSSLIIRIDRASGLLATEYTPASFIEEINFGQPHDILYYVSKDNPRGPAPTNPSSDSQFALWEAPVQAWAKKNGLISTSTVPTEKDNLHKPENQPIFTIEQPLEGQTITEPRLSVTLSGVTAPRGVNRVEYYINDNLLATVSNYPFNLDQLINFLTPGIQGLRVRICDDIDNCSEKSININLGFSPDQNIEPTLLWNQSVPEVDRGAVLNMSFTSSNIEAFSAIKIKQGSASSSSNSLVKTFSRVDLQPITPYSWTAPSQAGEYNLLLEGLTWGNNKILSPTVTIKVK
ncbi:penicillin-binding protein [Candidatus Falkowbacteria bacterium]|nr:penicillin-binding protein [Candidatus Falkowbacteria bacterium]